MKFSLKKLPQNIKKFISNYRLPLLAGLLVPFGYIPLPPVALFFCFVPLWLFWLAQEPTKKRVFWSGWLAQFVFNLIGFHWVAYTASEFGRLPWPVAIFVLLAFCSFGSIHIPLSGLMWVLVHKRAKFTRLQSLAFIAVSYLCLDAWMPLIFPWNMGYPWLWMGLPGYQWADVIGFQGLGAVTVLLNVFVLCLWDMRQQRRRLLQWSAIGVIVFAVFNISGHFHGQSWNGSDSKIAILAVQANIGNNEKLYADHDDRFRDIIIDRFIQYTDEGLQKHKDIDCIVWPETAFPHLLEWQYRKAEYQERLRRYVKKIGKPLVTGGLAMDYDPKPKNQILYNAIFFWDGDANPTFPGYRKTILLAFGEYLPGAQYIPFLQKLAPMVGNFGRGSGAIAVPFVKDIKLGPQICYEGLHPDFVLRQSRAGANIFVNVTNDSWFGTLFEPYQHMYMTLARAIEFRRPLIRVTNTGITTAILANGEILQQSPMHQVWTGKFEIPYQSQPPHTIYEKIGLHIPYVYIGLALVIILWRLVMPGKREE